MGVIIPTYELNTHPRVERSHCAQKRSKTVTSDTPNIRFRSESIKWHKFYLSLLRNISEDDQELRVSQKIPKNVQKFDFFQMNLGCPGTFAFGQLVGSHARQNRLPSFRLYTLLWNDDRPTGGDTPNTW